MNSDQQIAQDFAAAERWIWAACSYWQQGDFEAISKLVMAMEPGERLAFEIRLVNIVTGNLVSVFGDEGAREYIAEALSKAHAEGAS